MCTFSTSLKIAWPEHVYFKLEVGGLGEVKNFKNYTFPKLF